MCIFFLFLVRLPVPFLRVYFCLWPCVCVCVCVCAVCAGGASFPSFFSPFSSSSSAALRFGFLAAFQFSVTDLRNGTFTDGRSKKRNTKKKSRSARLTACRLASLLRLGFPKETRHERRRPPGLLRPPPGLQGVRAGAPGGPLGRGRRAQPRRRPLRQRAALPGGAHDGVRPRQPRPGPGVPPLRRGGGAPARVSALHPLRLLPCVLGQTQAQREVRTCRHFICLNSISTSLPFPGATFCPWRRLLATCTAPPAATSCTTPSWTRWRRSA